MGRAGFVSFAHHGPAVGTEAAEARRVLKLATDAVKRTGAIYRKARLRHEENVRIAAKYEEVYREKAAALNRDYDREEKRGRTPHYYTSMALIEAVMATLGRDADESAEAVRVARRGYVEAKQALAEIQGGK